MALKNYKTKVPASRTISEIGSLLALKGAERVSTEYGPKGEVAAVTFDMKVAGVLVHFRLPSNIPGVARCLSNGRTPTPKQNEHACWVSWRIVKDWIDAQIALIESQQAEPAQVFMPYAIGESRTGERKSMYELFIENNQKLLHSGQSPSPEK